MECLIPLMLTASISPAVLLLPEGTILPAPVLRGIPTAVPAEAQEVLTLPLTTAPHLPETRLPIRIPITRLSSRDLQGDRELIADNNQGMPKGIPVFIVVFNRIICSQR